ncbi:hypothetical protein AB7M17_007507 [Bradyrhizobium sp. USDA 377]
MSLVIRLLSRSLAVVIFACAATFAEAADGPITYFSDEATFDFAERTRPSSTDQVTVAKVRVLREPVFLVGPDQSGRPSIEKPREPYAAKLKVLDVIRGKRPAQELVSVTFGGGRGGTFTHTYALGPSTPRQLAQEYYVAMYEDALGFHLIGIPMSSERYREWQGEIARFEHERQRSPPK